MFKYHQVIVTFNNHRVVESNNYGIIHNYMIPHEIFGDMILNVIDDSYKYQLEPINATSELFEKHHIVFSEINMNEIQKHRYNIGIIDTTYLHFNRKLQENKNEE